MRHALILAALLALPALAAKPKPTPEPITLPDKYSPIFYEHLTGPEKTRCEKYVDELMLMEKRQRMGATKPWDLEKMKAKRQRIDADYDKYCLRMIK
ncbi:hypothetical protein [Chitinimonas koreensis]|uniref:hypothetical protein n=1 Tax=Chitinimonas koreensis TaxID=356302 RepID=UPI000428E9AB|nr:hypothetical protein [Chitinimonas koreensis]QNM97839.1 hypothetical protein H9L41_06085 [Chitinimonas koreensis]